MYEIGVFLTHPYTRVAAFVIVFILVAVIFSIVAADKSRIESDRRQREIKEFTSGVYRIEWIDADTIRLKRKDD